MIRERVLLIDDDKELVEMVRDYMKQEGFEVAAAHDGKIGMKEALSGQYAIAVVDVMMPSMNGIEVLRRIRNESAIPILMLTARGDDADRILGLELGADDYVPKPCTARELTARIRAILKRVGNQNGGNEHTLIKIGSLTVWPLKRKAEYDSHPVELTSTEFSLLEMLARNAGLPVSKEELSEHVLGKPLLRFDRAIDVHMSNIRQKLGTLSDGRSCIQTVVRKGYMLIEG